MKTKKFEIDLERLESLCLCFAEKLKHNRKNKNDGNMGILVLEDVKQRGELRENTKKRLLKWCYTDGALYQAGVELARKSVAPFMASFCRILTSFNFHAKRPHPR